MLGTSHEYLSAFNIVGSNVFSATIQATHYCASMAWLLLFVTLLTAIYARQQLLLSHGNSGCANAPICYVGGKLPILLKLLIQCVRKVAVHLGYGM
jgi:hypothetical protein